MPGLFSLSTLAWARRVSLISLLFLLIFAVVGCGGGNTRTAAPPVAAPSTGGNAAAPTVAAVGKAIDSSAAAATPTVMPKPTATRQAAPTPTTAPARVDTPPGMKTVSASSLPPEARKTLSLIQKGGPFPYSRDGIVFENREGRLPKKPSGYYHEYTVDTPGSSDRGARRIITGQNGEIYYTDDHYDTFVRVTP